MTEKKDVKKGIFLRVLSNTGQDNPQVGAVSKKTFFDQMENEYPEKDGWKVTGQNFIGEQRDNATGQVLGYTVIYFLEKA